MSTEYQGVKVGRLKLKGEKTKKHKSKKRKHEDGAGEGGSSSSVGNEEDQDTARHGGWWKTTAPHQIRGNVAIQMGQHAMFLTALDDGLFTVGPPHNEGEGPYPEEVLTSVPTGDTRKVALKSGYNKYLGVDAKGRVVGRAEAIGPREMWTPVYQDGETALLCATDCFVGLDDEDNVVATSAAVGPGEKLVIRCGSVREKDKKDDLPTEEQGSLKDIEVNYIKKFQKFQDKRMKVNPDGRIELKDAKDQGRLHEALLNRRSKMKADRYCK